MPDLASIVKAYDIRGTVPGQFDEAAAAALGTGFADLVRGHGATKVAVAHDMRDTGPGLARAFAGAITRAGIDVVFAGLCSTDELYFISGSLDVPGAMFTASHNPAEYNGIKTCLAGARPVSLDTGGADIRDRAQAILDGAEPTTADTPGTLTERDFLADYVAHLRTLVDLSGIRPLTVAVDAGNGMGGHTVPTAFEDLPFTVVPMYFELDGTFPNHEANPLEPKNLVDLQKKVVEVGADIGLAFDGDADRCFVIDENGDPVSPSAITALVAVRELARDPGATIIHNLITSRAVPEIVTENGGAPVRTRVGHSFIKAEMARTNAIFGGEHSAHYYFRDFWFADTGLLAAMHTLAALGGSDKPLSELAADYERYVASGEINSTVDDQAARLAAVEEAFAGEKIDHLDGLTITMTDGAWANLRASNTEPLLRLNVEASTPERMERLRDAVLAIVRG